jgi:hypothetical protein
MSNLDSHLGEMKGGVKQKANIMGSLWDTYNAGKKMAKQMKKEEQEEVKRAMEESKNPNPNPDP